MLDALFNWNYKWMEIFHPSQNKNGFHRKSLLSTRYSVHPVQEWIYWTHVSLYDGRKWTANLVSHPAVLNNRLRYFQQNILNVKLQLWNTMALKPLGMSPIQIKHTTLNKITFMIASNTMVIENTKFGIRPLVHWYSQNITLYMTAKWRLLYFTP